MAKKALLIRACGHDNEDIECENIKTVFSMYGIDAIDVCPKTNRELKDILDRSTNLDYIYLSSHGNEECFGNEDNSIIINWSKFGLILCESGCMNQDCIILLSCCRGGLHQVAYNLFYHCPKISYVVGPRQSLASHDMSISFSILLYNYERKSIDPVVACEKIKNATDLRFCCFDRLETEIDVSFKIFCSDNNIKVIS